MHATFVWTWQDIILAAFLSVTLALGALVIVVFLAEWAYRKAQALFRKVFRRD